jgi:hypothetical protein
MKGSIISIPDISGPLWIVFGLAVLIFFIMTVVILFHWNKYGMKSGMVIVAEIIYLAGSIVFLSSAMLSLIMFNS